MTISKKIFGTLAAGALAVSLSVAGGGTAGAATVFNPIKNTGSNMCLQPQGGSAGEANLVQATCNGGIAQGWLFQQLSGTTWRIINQLGNCMYMNGPVASGSPVAVVGCTPAVSNHSWQPIPAPPSIGTLKSRAGNATTLCLDVPGGQPTEGLPVRVFRCNGTPAQAWVMGF